VEPRLESRLLAEKLGYQNPSSHGKPVVSARVVTRVERARLIRRGEELQKLDRCGSEPCRSSGLLLREKFTTYPTSLDYDLAPPDKELFCPATAKFNC
jgi:hypothetical protein